MEEALLLRPPMSQIYWTNLVFNPALNTAVLDYRVSIKKQGKTNFKIRFDDCDYFQQGERKRIAELSGLNAFNWDESGGLVFTLKGISSVGGHRLKSSISSFYLMFLSGDMAAVLAAEEAHLLKDKNSAQDKLS